MTFTVADLDDAVVVAKSHLQRLQAPLAALSYGHVRQVNILAHVLENLGTLRIAFLGDFKRGKSSVINALIGERDLLPVHMIPCTSGIIEIVPTASGPGFLELVDGVWREVDAASFRAGAGGAVAEEVAGDPRHWRANVGWNSASAPMIFVDTPGMNEDAARSLAALEEAQVCSAAILVLSASQPMSRTEQDIATALAGMNTATAAIVNKFDEALASGTAEQVQESLRHIARRLNEAGLESPLILPFAALRPDGIAGAHSVDHLREEIYSFAAERSLEARRTKLIDALLGMSTTLLARIADRRGYLGTTAEEHRAIRDERLGHVAALEGRLESVRSEMQEDATSLIDDAVSAFTSAWDDLLAEWLEARSDWETRHTPIDPRYVKAAVDEITSDAQAHLIRYVEEWWTGYATSVVTARWGEIEERSMRRLADVLSTADDDLHLDAWLIGDIDLSALNGLTTSDAPDAGGLLAANIARSIGHSVTGIVASSALRAVVTKAVGAQLARTLGTFTIPAIGTVIGALMLVKGLANFKNELRKRVGKALAAELSAGDLSERIGRGVAADLMGHLEARVEELQTLIDEWMGDLREVVELAHDSVLESDEQIAAFERSAAAAESGLSELRVLAEQLAPR